MGSKKQITKITILGTNGMLGYALSEYYERNGYQVEKIDKSIFNVLKSAISELAPYIKESDFIVNCIGIIKPRISSMNADDALIVNGAFPKNLAKLARKHKIPCFHITTDCVYSGTKGSYNENDYFDITDLYGLSKNAGETTECMTLRTSIIGEEKNNKYSLVEWALSQKGKEVSGFENHIWNGVTTVYLAQVIEDIYRLGLYKEGLYHIYSPSAVNKYKLLSIINDVYKLNLKINKINASESVDRSLSSIYSLSSKVATKELSDQIMEMMQFFK